MEDAVQNLPKIHEVSNTKSPVSIPSATSLEYYKKIVYYLDVLYNFFKNFLWLLVSPFSVKVWHKQS